MTAGDDLDDVLRSTFDQLQVAAPPEPGTVRRRARRRQTRRRVAVGLGAVLLVVGGLALRPGADGATDVGIADTTPDLEARPNTASVESVDGWTWMANDQMVARDGSATGYGTRAGEQANGLVIYLENGHLCIDASTCRSARSSYTSETFRDEFLDQPRYNAGLFDAELERNPFAGWSAVFVPHATGDLHAGVNHEAQLPGVPGKHAMVGANNVEAMLVDLVARGIAPENVVVTGTGAGGLGALLNYERVVAAFPDASVSLMVDSVIVPLTTADMPNCLVNAFARGWQRSYPDDWDQVIDGRYDQRFAGIYEYLSLKYPDATFGLLSSSGDTKVRAVLGRGVDDCTGTEPLPEARYERAVTELVAHLEQFDNWFSFVVDGDEHGFLTGGNPDIDTDEEHDGIRRWLDVFRPEQS